jgi:hypothetical protein
MLAPNIVSSAEAENAVRTTTVSPRTRFDNEAIRRWIQTEDARMGWTQVERPATGLTAPVSGQDLSTRAPSAPPPDLGVVRYPSPERNLPREVVLQEWEGQVQEVGELVFSARLVDLTRELRKQICQSTI